MTYNRIPLLTGEESGQILHLHWKIGRERHPFTTVEICLLPDHIHALRTLPRIWRRLININPVKHGLGK